MVELWQDRRVGGQLKWRHCERAKLMRVPDELIECVAFIQAEDSGGRRSIGSAFFVGVSLELSDNPALDRVILYAVTAKHCLSVEGLPATAVQLIANRHDGTAEFISTAPADWLRHPVADVAVLPISLQQGKFKFRAFAAASSATKAFMDERNVGPGDDVFMAGLLVHHPGKPQIMPIVRVGNIAALPNDAVNLTTGPDVVALIEARSIGGLSGSPVFVHLPFWRDPPKGMVLMGDGGTANSGGTHHLLGVMHGFYPVGQNDPDGVSQGDENLNTGIAVVAFADRILDLINGDSEMKRRIEIKAAYVADTAPFSESSNSRDIEPQMF